MPPLWMPDSDPVPRPMLTLRAFVELGAGNRPIYAGRSSGMVKRVEGKEIRNEWGFEAMVRCGGKTSDAQDIAGAAPQQPVTTPTTPASAQHPNHAAGTAFSSQPSKPRLAGSKRCASRGGHLAIPQA